MFMENGVYEDRVIESQGLRVMYSTLETMKGKVVWIRGENHDALWQVLSTCVVEGAIWANLESCLKNSSHQRTVRADDCLLLHKKEEQLWTPEAILDEDVAKGPPVVLGDGTIAWWVGRTVTVDDEPGAGGRYVVRGGHLVGKVIYLQVEPVSGKGKVLYTVLASSCTPFGQKEEEEKANPVAPPVELDKRWAYVGTLPVERVAAPPRPLTVGDVVRLRSGGPDMTIGTINGQFAICHWFERVVVTMAAGGAGYQTSPWKMEQVGVPLAALVRVEEK